MKAEEIEDRERHSYADMKSRTPLHMIAIAAWVGVPVEKLPDHPTFRTYPNSDAEAGWTRVCDAIAAEIERKRQE